VIAAGGFTSIEALSFNARFASEPAATPSYDITLANGNIAAGAALIVNASSLVAGQTLTFDGCAETLGRFTIYGGGGNDRLIGGANADFIYAAGGIDTLTGGGGPDTFQYRDVSDSTPGAFDTINGFESGIDKIDIAQVDAVGASGGDDGFTWIGSADFSNVAGQLRADYDTGSGAWTVQGDIDGDGLTDLQILVYAPTLVSGDFLL
jgi:Ca2+-binding RTX toxin-like protein